MGRRPTRLALLFSVGVLVAAGCQRTAPPESAGSPHPAATSFPLTLTDDEGVQTTLPRPPQRIVTFAPSDTEIVYGLGLGDRLVGVSGPFDDYPPAAEDVTEVAGANGTEPNIEKVVSLQPQVVLTAFIGGGWKDRLRELQVPVFTTLAADLEDALADIDTIGRLLGAEPQARALTAEMRNAAEQIETGASQQAPVSCFLDLGDLYTVGPGAIEYDLLQRAGCDPVTSSATQPYPQWSAEQLVQDDPEVFLITSDSGESLESLRREPGVGDLSAVQAGRVEEVDGDLVTRPGPRIIEGLRQLADALHG